MKGVEYADALYKEVYFAGDGASFVFKIITREEAPKC
jgi:hypothetical protein